MQINLQICYPQSHVRYTLRGRDPQYIGLNGGLDYVGCVGGGVVVGEEAGSVPAHCLDGVGGQLVHVLHEGIKVAALAPVAFEVSRAGRLGTELFYSVGSSELADAIAAEHFFESGTLRR